MQKCKKKNYHVVKKKLYLNPFNKFIFYSMTFHQLYKVRMVFNRSFQKLSAVVYRFVFWKKKVFMVIDFRRDTTVYIPRKSYQTDL